MKSSLRIIADCGRATHMPTARRPRARLKSAEGVCCRRGFWRVVLCAVTSRRLDARESGLAKSVCAVSASHSANVLTSRSGLFAKRPRARTCCPGLLRGIAEKESWQRSNRSGNIWALSRICYVVPTEPSRKNLAQPWPSGLRCQSFIATVSRLTQEELPG